MSHSQKGRELLHDLRFEVAQLDLLASTVVREAAYDLLAQHAHESQRVVQTILGADDDEGRRHAKAELTRLLNAVFYGAREDLGLDVGKPSKRLMRKVNSAIYGS
jgi:hypothetical protein